MKREFSLAAKLFAEMALLPEEEPECESRFVAVACEASQDRPVRDDLFLPTSRAYVGHVHESKTSRERRPTSSMTCAAAYGPTPGNANKPVSSSSSGSSRRGAARHASRSIWCATVARASACKYAPRYPARATSRKNVSPAAAICAAVGKARPCQPVAGAPAAGVPRWVTSAAIIRCVADHAQFVVQSVHDVFEGGRRAQQPPESGRCKRELAIAREARIRGREIIVESEYRTHRRDDLGGRTRRRRASRHADRERSGRLFENNDGAGASIAQAQRRRRAAFVRRNFVRRQPPQTVRTQRRAQRNGLATRAHEGQR